MEKISEVTYHSEGKCSAKIGARKIAINLDCDTLSDPEKFRSVNVDSDDFQEQWIHVKCDDDGTEAFVQDSELLKQPGVTKGQIVEFGKVK